MSQLYHGREANRQKKWRFNPWTGPVHAYSSALIMGWKMSATKGICVTPIDIFPLIKRVTQFLITPFSSKEGKKCLVSFITFLKCLKVNNCDTKRNVYLLWQAGINFFSFYRKISHPFCSTLTLIAIPWPTASGLQTGGHSRANRRV